MSDYALSPQQLAVICALSSGASITSAAEEAGVHRNTITNWRRNLLPFQRALADAQYDRALLCREKIEDLVDLAVQAIQQILADPKTPPSIRLKAALAIIQLSAKPPEPKQQVELLFETVPVETTPPVHKPAQPEPVPTVHNSAPPDQPDVHNSAQQPIRREHPKIGRNEPCPCNSGLKFKRCCLDKPNPQPYAAAA